MGSRERQAPGPAKPREVVQEPPSDTMEADPWLSIPAMEESVDTFENEALVPTCLHGAMIRKSGISKKTGKPYAGYFCQDEPQCDPKFDRS
jgi:hypothetical protein